MHENATLGTLLRHLTELCDIAVEQAYADAGLDYRARYTPIVKALRERGPCSMRALSVATGVSHSAVSQTVAQMHGRGLVQLQAGRDARERIVALSAASKRLLPRLQTQWDATERAARSIDDELGFSLSDVLQRAITVLERQPFADRIAAGHAISQT